MKKFIYKTVSLILFFIFSLTYIISADYIIWEEKTEKVITRGVVHTSVKTFFNSGWQRADILKIDLNDDNVSLSSLYDSRGISYLKTLSKMAEEEGVVAAVNADFFNWNNSASGRGSALGLTAKEGEIVSSPSHDTGLASLVQAEDGSVLMDYFTMKLFAIAPNGNRSQILHINKYHSIQSIVMFTPEWGETSPGSQNGAIELVASDGKVVEIRQNMPPAEIPENGFVLATSPEVNRFFIDNFVIGDSIELEQAITPDYGKIKTAVGGGTVLVKEGKRATFTNNITGNNPRTAAGVDKTGKILYLVTIEGRQAATSGMTQEQLADYMISLGAYTAINFDGGGSTTMVARNDTTGSIGVVNRPSEGSLRAISTGIGVKTVSETGRFSHLALKASQENVFLGDSVDIWTFAKDNYYNPISLDNPKFKYTSDDDGEFKDNKYFPKKSGTRTITVSLGDVSSTITINALSEVAQISLYPDLFNITAGNSQNLSVIAKDSNGFTSALSPDKVKWSIANGDASIKNGIVTANKSGTFSAKATVGGFTAYAIANFGGTTFTTNYGFEDEKGAFSPYPDYVKGSYSLVSDPVKAGKKAGQLSYEFSADKTESQAAHVYFGKNIPLGSSSKIGLWVWASPENGHWLRGQLDTANGEVVRITFASQINWEGYTYLEVEIPQEAKGGYLSKIYLVSNNQSNLSGKIVLDDLNLFSEEENDVTLINTPFKDMFTNSFTPSSGAFTFAVAPAKNEATTLLENLVNIELEKNVSKYNKTFTFGKYDSSTDVIENYSISEENGNLFMKLNNSKNGIRATNAQQWHDLIRVSNTTDAKNAFIFLSNGLDSAFTDPAELQLFKSTLTNLFNRGTNVFVMSVGSKAFAEVLNGVRYITIPKTPLVTTADFFGGVETSKYLKFTVDGQNVQYEFLPILSLR